MDITRICRIFLFILLSWPLSSSWAQSRGQTGQLLQLHSPAKVADLVLRHSLSENWDGLLVLTAPGNLDASSRLQVPLENVDAADWFQIHENMLINYRKPAEPRKTVKLITAENGQRLCLIQEIFDYQLQYKEKSLGNRIGTSLGILGEPFREFGALEVKCASSRPVETSGHDVRGAIPETQCTNSLEPNRRFCGVDRIAVTANPLPADSKQSEEPSENQLRKHLKHPPASAQ